MLKVRNKMKKHIVILSGAGMSAESGIATFRDSDGLWENYRVEDVASLAGFERDPQLVLDFYNQRRKEVFKVSPNRGHEILAELEADYDVSVVTQNVDNLHERAGSTNVLHLHGEILKVHSTGNPADIRVLTEDNPEINLGDVCDKGYQLRPHIVWFGEVVPMIEKAIEIVAKADILVIIGTSMNVYPAASLIDFAPKGIPIYIVDPKPIVAQKYNIQQIQKGASEGLAELVEILKMGK